ncbi:UxaA family hydrolase [Sulfobacillus harzensis]|nr:SAF domain-containing protein [Sulfobacillus harzensis]
MSTLMQWWRWKTAAGFQEGIMREEDPGAVVLEHATPTPASLGGVVEYCRTAHIQLTDWAEALLAKMPARERIPKDAIECPVDLELLFGCQAVAEDQDAPAIYLKASQTTLAGPRQSLGLRPDVAWHVAHPAIIAVFGPHGDVLGFSLGLDVTALELLTRHPLHLQEAKWFQGSAAMGPVLALASSGDLEHVEVRFQVWRRGQVLVRESCAPVHLSARLEMARRVLTWMPHVRWFGVMLPLNVSLPEVFQLEEGDEVSVSAPGLGEFTAMARSLQPVSSQETREPRVLLIHPNDTVAVALDPIQAGTSISIAGIEISVRDDIPFGHKVAIRDLEAGDWVIKYGEKIGVASQPIHSGEHVHTHNLESSRGRGDLLVAEREVQ